MEIEKEVVETKEGASKVVLISIICVVAVLLVASYMYLVDERPMEDTQENIVVDTNTDTNNEEQVEKEVEITTIEFDENTNLEEAEGKIYEEYSNNNLRIVGAIIQEVNDDHIIVKTYRAGVGTESIVEEKKINITSNTLVFETIVSPEKLDNEPVTTRKTIASLKAGDHIVIECAEDKSTKGADEFTALIITRDVLIFDEPVENEEVE